MTRLEQEIYALQSGRNFDTQLGNSNKTNKWALDDITQARGRVRVGPKYRHQQPMQ
jgi:hypothetical protein